MAILRQAEMGIIGWVAAIDAGYTPAVDDLVKMSGDLEVAAVTDGAVVAGRVYAIEAAAGNRAAKVTIWSDARRESTGTADDAIAAGELVVATGIDTVRKYVAGVDDASLNHGLCLVGGGIGATVTYLEK